MPVHKDGQHSSESRFDELSDVDLYNLVGDTAHGQAAFRELYNRLSGQLYAYCKTLAWHRNESDDLFQEAFARLYECALQQRSVSNVAGYLIKIARNLWLNIQRDRKPTVSIDQAEHALHEMPHERSEMLDLIRMAMELLPEDYREAMYLREFADMPYDEIAEQLGISQGNVRIRVARARERIRKILEPYINDYVNEIQRPKP
jgi:RNA polymerase sigma factor (sigma-70 family)